MKKSEFIKGTRHRKVYLEARYVWECPKKSCKAENSELYLDEVYECPLCGTTVQEN